MIYRIRERVNQWREAWRRMAGRGQYPHEFAFLLLLPFRKFILSPRELVRRLGLRRDWRVLEIGPGPGYFSIEVARAIPDGRLTLLDSQIEMLRKARARLTRAGIRNVAFVQADAASLPFAPESFDVVFYVAVLGEVPDPIASLRESRRILQPNGQISITELAGDPDAFTESDLLALASQADLSACETFRKRRGFTINLEANSGSGKAISPPKDGAEA